MRITITKHTCDGCKKPILLGHKYHHIYITPTHSQNNNYNINLTKVYDICKTCIKPLPKWMKQ